MGALVIAGGRVEWLRIIIAVRKTGASREKGHFISVLASCSESC